MKSFSTKVDCPSKEIGQAEEDMDESHKDKYEDVQPVGGFGQ